MIGNVLKDDRTTGCCNKWQPLENPKDPNSSPIEIPLSGITGKFMKSNRKLSENKF